MKLTKKDLRKIILEEIEAVLNEESALQPDTVEPKEDDGKTLTTQDASVDLYSLAKEMQSNPEMRKQITPQELEKWMEITRTTLEMATDPEKKNNAVELERILNRIKNEQGQ